MIDDCSFNTWIEGANYSETKKAKFRRLRKEYEQGLLSSTDLRIYHIKGFIKNESYPEFKPPRCILARSDEYKIIVAPIIKMIEKIVFNSINSNGYCHFIKKIPVPERPKYILDNIGYNEGFVDDQYAFKRRYLIADYSSYESGFKREFMEKCEFIMYEFLVSQVDSKDFLEYLGALKNNNLVYMSCAKMKLVGRRMSGEMNTSLGNGFSNLMKLLHSFEKFNCQDVRVLVEGDDSLCSYIGPMLPQHEFESYGFIVKMKYLTLPNLASFCGQIFDIESLTVIGDPIKIILNFSWCNMAYSQSSDEVCYGLLRARAMSIFYQFVGCPILQAFSLSMLQYVSKYDIVIDKTMDSYKKQILVAAMEKMPSVRQVEMTSRITMFDVFGITVSDQIRIEKYFEKEYPFGPIPCVVLGEYVNSIYFYNNMKYVR